MVPNVFDFIYYHPHWNARARALSITTLHTQLSIYHIYSNWFDIDQLIVDCWTYFHVTNDHKCGKLQVTNWWRKRKSGAIEKKRKRIWGIANLAPHHHPMMTMWNACVSLNRWRLFSIIILHYVFVRFLSLSLHSSSLSLTYRNDRRWRRRRRRMMMMFC